MRYLYQPAFLDATRQLSHAHAAQLLRAVEKFQSAIESHQWPRGLGIAHLRAHYFEFCVDIRARVSGYLSSVAFTDGGMLPGTPGSSTRFS